MAENGDGREALYKMIISQLVYDGLDEVARILARSVGLREISLISSCRLLKVINLGLQVEREGKERETGMLPPGLASLRQPEAAGVDSTSKLRFGLDSKGLEGDSRWGDAACVSDMLLDDVSISRPNCCEGPSGCCKDGWNASCRSTLQSAQWHKPSPGAVTALVLPSVNISVFEITSSGSPESTCAVPIPSVRHAPTGIVSNIASVSASGTAKPLPLSFAACPVVTALPTDSHGSPEKSYSDSQLDFLFQLGLIPTPLLRDCPNTLRKWLTMAHDDCGATGSTGINALYDDFERHHVKVDCVAPSMVHRGADADPLMPLAELPSPVFGVDDAAAYCESLSKTASGDCRSGNADCTQVAIKSPGSATRTPSDVSESREPACSGVRTSGACLTAVHASRLLPGFVIQSELPPRAEDTSGSHFAIADSPGPHFAIPDTSRSHVVTADTSGSHFAIVDTSGSHFAIPDTSRSHVVTADNSGSHIAVPDTSGSHFAIVDNSGSHFAIAETSRSQFTIADTSGSHFAIKDTSGPRFDREGTSGPMSGTAASSRLLSDIVNTSGLVFDSSRPRPSIAHVLESQVREGESSGPGFGARMNAKRFFEHSAVVSDALKVKLNPLPRRKTHGLPRLPGSSRRSSATYADGLMSAGRSHRPEIWSSALAVPQSSELLIPGHDRFIQFSSCATDSAVATGVVVGPSCKRPFGSAFKLRADCKDVALARSGRATNSTGDDFESSTGPRSVSGCAGEPGSSFLHRKAKKRCDPAMNAVCLRRCLCKGSQPVPRLNSLRSDASEKSAAQASVPSNLATGTASSACTRCDSCLASLNSSRPVSCDSSQISTEVSFNSQCLHLRDRVLREIASHNITQAVFARASIGKSQGYLSDLLKRASVLSSETVVAEHARAARNLRNILDFLSQEPCVRQRAYDAYVCSTTMNRAGEIRMRDEPAVDGVPCKRRRARLNKETKMALVAYASEEITPEDLFALAEELSLDAATIKIFLRNHKQRTKLAPS